MFDQLFFSTRNRSFLKQKDGAKKFAELVMGQLILNVSKKLAVYREMNENLQVEQESLRARLKQLQNKPALDAQNFHSVQRRIWASFLLVGFILVMSVLLNQMALSALAVEFEVLQGPVSWLLAIVLAAVLTGTGIVVAQHLIGSLFMGAKEEETFASRLDKKNMWWLWAVLLVGVELALFGIAEVAARAFAQQANASALYYGVIAMSLFLPVIGGVIRWDASRFIDRYKATQSIRSVEHRLDQINSTLRQNEKFEHTLLTRETMTHWAQLTQFKSKQSRMSDVESLDGHFADSFTAFQEEADKRFASGLQQRTAERWRRILDKVQERETGATSGAAKSRIPASLMATPPPAEADPDGFVSANPRPKA